MKRTVLWLALAAALVFTGLLPFEATDASKLQPAHVLLVWQDGGLVRTQCDADAQGRGVTLEEAIWDMQRTADGKLFLDTAEHIVFADGAPQLLMQAAENKKLRPAAHVWLLRGELPKVEQAASFLKNRAGTVTLGRIRAANFGAMMPQVPYLIQQDGRLMTVGV
ncbi:MAG: hypothetical protein IIV87_04585 [Oscillospiraceae bacterium]|nr:hypothetical protein [Oscillospiraceae bacterium]